MRNMDQDNQQCAHLLLDDETQLTYISHSLPDSPMVWSLFSVLSTYEPVTDRDILAGKVPSLGLYPGYSPLLAKPGYC